MVTTRPGWAVTAKTVTGPSHLVNGRPNQDAVVIRQAGNGVVLAVADGHGGQRHAKSDIGSRLAAEIGCARGLSLLDQGSITSRDAGEMATAIVDEWQHAVREHGRRHPPSRESDDTRDGFTEDDIAVLYGSTLLLAVLSPRGCLFGQIGDGDIAALTLEGQVLRPVCADRNIGGNLTTSLCQRDAAAHFQFSLMSESQSADLRIVLLATDGYGNSFASPGWYPDVLSDLDRMFAAVGMESLDASLSGWLGESAEVTGDDTTIALAFRDQGRRTGSDSGRRVRNWRRWWSRDRHGGGGCD